MCSPVEGSPHSSELASRKWQGHGYTWPFQRQDYLSLWTDLLFWSTVQMEVRVVTGQESCLSVLKKKKKREYPVLKDSTACLIVWMCLAGRGRQQGWGERGKANTWLWTRVLPWLTVEQCHLYPYQNPYICWAEILFCPWVRSSHCFQWTDQGCGLHP